MNLSFSDSFLMLHILFWAAFLGGQLAYLFIIQPASYRFFSANDQARFLQNVLRRQNPVLMLFLCLVVMSGGFMIAPLKNTLGDTYYSIFGTKLITKLGYFFVIFFITAYQTLSVGFKIRYLDPAKDLTSVAQKLGQVRTQMTITSILNILVTLYVIYLARYS